MQWKVWMQVEIATTVMMLNLYNQFIQCFDESTLVISIEIHHSEHCKSPGGRASVQGSNASGLNQKQDCHYSERAVDAVTDADLKETVGMMMMMMKMETEIGVKEERLRCGH